MTMAELGARLGIASLTLPNALTRAGHRIGKAAVRYSRAKLGKDQADWPPLAQSTLDKKALYGWPSPSPLLVFGDLRDSITYEVVKIAAGVEIDFYSTSPIAPVQELGGGPSNIPPRPFIASTVFEQLSYYEHIAGQAVFGTVVADVGEFGSDFGEDEEE